MCFRELFSCPLSEGTLANIIKQADQKARQTLEPIRQALLEPPVAHADETSCRVNRKRYWWHVFSNDQLTIYYLDLSRGVDGIKRGKVPNLLDRLDCYGGEIMRYFEVLIVPYDKNQAERDLRMMKVKEKISGQFRNYEHGQAFGSIRSVISTVRKQSGDTITRITRIVEEPQTLGQQLARAGRPE